MKGFERRLLRDLKKLQQEKSQDFVAAPVAGDLQKWDASLFGPNETEWQGAVLKLSFEFPVDYPTVAPVVKFVSTIPFHPNVYQNGKICIDLLQHNWSPAYDVSAILTSILSLLVAPNPNSPSNNSAAELWTKNRDEYNRMVRKSVESSWNAAT